MAHIWRSLKSYIWIPSYSKGALPAGVLHVRHDSFICVIWLIHKCKMAHSHVWHEFCIRLTWHGTRTCLSNGSFICHFYVGHVSWTRVRITQFSFVSRPRVCRSSMNESCKTCTYYTIHETWLRVYILHMRHGILQMRYYKWDILHITNETWNSWDMEVVWMSHVRRMCTYYTVFIRLTWLIHTASAHPGPWDPI